MNKQVITAETNEQQLFGGLPPIVVYSRAKRLAMSRLEHGDLKGAVESLLEAKRAQIYMIEEQRHALHGALEKLS